MGKSDAGSLARPLVRKRKNRFRNYRTLLFMCAPAIVFFLVFAYIPMPGLYIAFTQFNYKAGIFASPFIGFHNFDFLAASGDLLRLTWNTVGYNFLFILTSNVVQIVVALMLNEIASRTFKKFSQTLMLLPYFVSWVLVGLLAYNFLSYEFGMLNGVLKTFGLEPVEVYSNSAIWPAILTFANLWKVVGYGSIIYFASLMSVDTAVIEAAMIDGASAWQRIRYVLLPALRPTFIILLLFSLGGVLRGNFDMFYNLVGANNSALFGSTDIIETFVFRSLMNNFNFSLASAVSLYQAVFGFVLIMVCNWIVKKIEPEYALF
jgi:putative aldouronate transport system permease protein